MTEISTPLTNKGQTGDLQGSTFGRKAKDKSDKWNKSLPLPLPLPLVGHMLLWPGSSGMLVEEQILQLHVSVDDMAVM